MNAELRHSEAPLANSEPSPRVHMVWTRGIDGVPMVGRIKVAQGVRAAFRNAGFSVTESTLRPLTNVRSARRLAAALGRLLGAMAKGRLVPLQCLLFGDPAEARRAIAEMPADCDLVYLDGVRCLTLLEELARRPELPILTDFDDLMSRRMSLLLELGHAPSTGYLKSSMPRFVERLIASPALSRLLLRYEAASLRQVERRFAVHSDAMVLISGEDAAVLRRLAPRAAVRAIPLAAQVRRTEGNLAVRPLRFIFVGTDALRQNQLTIDALIELWRREQIATPLVVYGEQHRAPSLPPNVSMPGYAANLDDIYDGRSILLSPSYIAGGLKTKVIEAFAYGAPVLGNRVTFEGIEIRKDYPLLVANEAEMLPLIRDPERFRDRFERAAAMGLQIVREHHDPVRVDKAWRETAVAAMGRRHVTKAPF
jgi:glycosyltransferase involved in cell wall biosynthesis